MPFPRLLSFSFKILGVFRSDSPDDFVALVVSTSEAKWPRANPVMPYLAVNNTERYKKTRSIGGTFVESLLAGDQVTIVQHGKGARFVYSGDGGRALTFNGDLIAESP